ncbi:hypothetical protein Bbelb_115060 [Branchiostoma belcheri]|nr:hypothetical protein Bbelb_115060 [Branchiostoma belcheri]
MEVTENKVQSSDGCSAKPSLRGKNSLGSKSSLAAAYYSLRSQKKITPTPNKTAKEASSEVVDFKPQTVFSAWHVEVQLVQVLLSRLPAAQAGTRHRYSSPNGRMATLLATHMDRAGGLPIIHHLR